MSVKKLIRGLWSNRLIRVGANAFGSVEDLLVYLKNEYSPEFLLGFEEQSGLVAEDSSGNGNDFEYDQAPTYGVGPLLGPDGKGVRLPAVIEGGVYSSGVAYGFSNTVIVIFKPNSGSNGRIYNAGVSAFHLFVRRSGTFQFYEGSYLNTGIVCNNGQTYVASMVLDDEASTVTLYINGLAVFTGTHTGRDNNGSEEIEFGELWRSAGNADQLDADITIGTLIDRVTLDYEQYDIAQQAGATPNEGHFYWEKIRNDIGIHKLIKVHHPLWEPVGTQAISVDSEGNHGTYTASPTLGQPPLRDGGGALYSIDTNVNGYVSTAIVDLAATDGCTFAMTFEGNGANLEGLFNQITSAAEYFGAYTLDSPDRVVVRARDGVVGQLVSMEGNSVGEVYTLVGRLDLVNETIDMWINGVKGTTKSGSLTGVAMKTPADAYFLEDGGLGGIDTFNGKAELLTLVDYPLPDEQCEALSSGNISREFAPSEGHYLNKVIDDELGIAHKFDMFVPFWENAGGDFIDMTGNGNGLTAVGAMQPGQTPRPDGGSVYSVKNQSLTAYCSGTVRDAAAGLTVGLTFKTTSFVTAGVFANGDTSYTTGPAFRIFQNVSGTISYRYYDATNTVYGNTSSAVSLSEWATIVLRFDPVNDTFDLWLDGVQQTSVDLTAATHGAWSGNMFFGWDDSLNKLRADYEKAFAITSVLTDAQCQRLSEGTI